MSAPAPAASRVADIAVVGAGAAGLYASLCAARAGARATALWNDGERCRGLFCDGELVHARVAVIIATGGAAALWSRTTNPPGSQGAGLLLAHSAGALLADLELLQFHPTAVIGVPGREGFLVIWHAADGDLVYEQQRFRERRVRPNSSGWLGAERCGGFQ